MGRNGAIRRVQFGRCISFRFSVQLVPPVPLYYNMYFFHVENPVEYAQGLEKPRVKEIGPYAFEETRRKEQIIMVNVDQINFGQNYAFYWDQSETDRLYCVNPRGEYSCTKDDRMTVLNAVQAAVVTMLVPKLGEEDFAYKLELLEALNVALTDPTACPGCQEGLFINTTPMEFLFEGYAMDGAYKLYY